MVNPRLLRSMGMIGGYIFTFWLVRLVFLTLVTFTYVRTSEKVPLQNIGDIVRANLVLVYGLAALLFVVSLQLLQPLTKTSLKQVFHWRELQQRFAPNALNGVVLAIVLIAGSTLGGYMSYLGVYMKFNEVAMALGSAILFGTFLFLMVVVEEHILRSVLERRLADHLPLNGNVAASCVATLLIKGVQFDLDWLGALNLCLLNITLSMIARHERSAMASATFAAAFFIVVHIIFGLPFMGEDMPGIFLLRSSADEGLGSLLSGGPAGPEAGLVLTVLLAIYLCLPQIRSKKIEV